MVLSIFFILFSSVSLFSLDDVTKKNNPFGSAQSFSETPLSKYNDYLPDLIAIPCLVDVPSPETYPPQRLSFTIYATIIIVTAFSMQSQE
jgi:hypothetical protein